MDETGSRRTTAVAGLVTGLVFLCLLAMAVHERVAEDACELEARAAAAP